MTKRAGKGGSKGIFRFREKIPVSYTVTGTTPSIHCRDINFHRQCIRWCNTPSYNHMQHAHCIYTVFSMLHIMVYPHRTIYSCTCGLSPSSNRSTITQLGGFLQGNWVSIVTYRVTCAMCITQSIRHVCPPCACEIIKQNYCLSLQKPRNPSFLC